MFRVETNENMNNWMESLKKTRKSKTEYFADRSKSSVCQINLEK